MAHDLQNLLKFSEEDKLKLLEDVDAPEENDVPKLQDVKAPAPKQQKQTAEKKADGTISIKYRLAHGDEMVMEGLDPKTAMGMYIPDSRERSLILVDLWKVALDEANSNAALSRSASDAGSF